MFVNSSIEHVMFECTAKDVIRQKYRIIIMEVCLVQLIVAMNRMLISERSGVWLDGL